MFKWISNIKDVVTILSIVATLGLGYWGNIQKQEAARATNNLHSITRQYTDKTGALVTEVTELRFTNKELKQIAMQDSTKMSSVQKDLLQAQKKISELRIKERDVESYNKVLLESKSFDLSTTPTYDSKDKLMALKPIKTDHLEIKFKVQGDTILVDHKYNATITTVVSRERDKVTYRGKKRFFLARWVSPRWKYSAKNVADDKNAELVNAVNINFQRTKGGR